MFSRSAVAETASDTVSVTEEGTGQSIHRHSLNIYSRMLSLISGIFSSSKHRVYRLEIASFLHTFSHVGRFDLALCDLYSPLLPLSLSLWFNSNILYKHTADRARTCKPFQEPGNRFPAWQAGTATLFVVPAR